MGVKIMTQRGFVAMTILKGPPTNVVGTTFGTVQSTNFPNHNNGVVENCYIHINVTAGNVLRLELTIYNMTWGYDSFKIHDDASCNNLAVVFNMNRNQLYRYSMTILTTNNYVCIYYWRQTIAIGWQIIYTEMTSNSTYGLSSAWTKYGTAAYNNATNSYTLVPMAANKTGGVWNTMPWPSSTLDFTIKADVMSNFNSEGFALWLAANSTSFSANYPYCVNPTTFAGIGVFVQPAANSTFIDYIPTAAGSNANMASCSFPGNYRQLCGAFQSWPSSTVTIFLTIKGGTSLSATITGPGSYYIAITSSFNPSPSFANLVSGQTLLVGVSAYNSMTNFFSQLLASLKVYTPTSGLCSPNCNANSYCYNGTCVCLYHWNGTDCLTPICTLPCQNGGVCSLPDSCSCPAGFTEADCSTTYCTTLNSLTDKTAGTVFSDGYQYSYYYQTNCDWAISVWPGHSIHIEFFGLGLENNGYDQFNIYDGPNSNATQVFSVNGAMASNLLFGNILTTSNTAYVTFVTSPLQTGRTYNLGFYFYFYQVKLNSSLSFLNNSTANYNLYLPTGGPTIPPNGYVQLVQAAINQDGVMLSKNPLPNADFVVRVVANTGLNGSLGVLFLANDSLFYSSSPGWDYCVRWNYYAGLSLFANSFSNSIYGFFQPNISSIANIQCQQSNVYTNAACTEASIRSTTFELVIGLTIGRQIWVSYRTSGSNQWKLILRGYNLPNPLWQLPSPIYLGLAAHNGDSADSVEVQSVSYYLTGTTCVSPCMNGLCVDGGVCSCYGGWAGTACQTPVCPFACSNGICSSSTPYSSDRFCLCNSGWTGVNCSLQFCNTTITLIANATAQTFNSSNFNLNLNGTYSNGERCGWMLMAPVGSSVKVVITVTTMGGDGDKLEVYDGIDNSALMIFQSYTNMYQLTISSSSNFMFVYFYSDASNPGLGFTASYLSTALSLITGFIFNRAGCCNADNYAYNNATAWLVNVRLGNTILVTAGTSNIYDGVANHGMLAYDGSNMSAPLMGNLPNNYISEGYRTNGNSAFLRMISISSSNRFGFGFNEQLSNITGCPSSTTYVNQTGLSFNTGGSLGYYLRNQNCSWSITVLPGYVVQLTVISANQILGHPNGDYIYVYDGINAASRVLSATYSYDFTSKVTTSTNQAFVWFYSNNDYIVGNGYSVFFTQIPATDGLVSGNLIFGHIFPSPYYPYNSNYGWRYTVPSNYTIWAEVFTYYIDNVQGFYLYDGPDDTFPLIINLKFVDIHKVFSTTGSSLYVKFMSSNPWQGNGFSINWKQQSAVGSCAGSTYINGTTPGTISTENYPVGTYNKNDNCQWTIEVASGNAVSMTVTSSLMGGTGDTVQVYDGTSGTGTMIFSSNGSYYAASLVTATSLATVVFISNSDNYTGFGFQVAYQQVVTTNAVYGLLQSVNWPNGSYYPTQDDAWLFNIPSAYLLSFVLQTGTLASGDKVLAYNGPDATWPLISQVTSNNSLQNFAASGTSIYMCFRSTSNDLGLMPIGPGSGFRLTFQQVANNPCVTTTTISGQQSGTITSQNYPNGNYLPRENCGWNITVSSGAVVEINITTYVMGGTGDFLNVYDGPTMANLLLFKSPASYYKAFLTTTTNYAFILFTSNNDTLVGSGFIISWAEVAPTSSMITGVVESLNWPTGPCYDFENGAWAVNVPNGYIIEYNLESSPWGANGSDTMEFYGNNGSTYMTRTHGGNTHYQLATVSWPNLYFTFTTIPGYNRPANARWQVSYQQASLQSCPNSTVNIIANQTGYFSSPGYPYNYYHNYANCQWLVTAPAGYLFWIDLTVDILEYLIDWVYIYDGTSLAAPMLFSYATINYKGTFLTTANAFFVRFTSNGPFIVGTGWQIYYKLVVNEPHLSYTYANFANDWAANVIPSAITGAVPLTPNSGPSAGAMINMMAFNISDFILDVSVNIGNTGTGTYGVSIFFVTSNSVSTALMYGIDWTVFSGLAVIASPFANAIYAKFKPAPAVNTSTACGTANGLVGYTACGNVLTLRQNISLTVSLSSGRYLGVSYCTNGTASCSVAYGSKDIGNTLSSVTAPIYFGIAGYNDATNYDSINLLSANMYLLPTPCTVTCINGYCLSGAMCYCYAGWTGSLCNVPICPQGCLNGGSCTAPGICGCAIGWTGLNCTTPFCNFNSTINLLGLGNYTFFSDNYPLNYFDNERCALTVVATGNYYISVKFNASTMDVGNDFLYVYDNKYNFMAFEATARCFVANLQLSNNITLYFVSDNNGITGSGFFVNFTLGLLSATTNVTTGYVNNGNCNGNYLTNDTSQWTVRVQPGWVQFCDISTFSLGNLGDGVSLYDGPNSTSRFIANIASAYAPGNRFVTHTHEAFVKFNSGSPNTAAGFAYAYNQMSAATGCSPLTNYTNQLSGSFASEYFWTGFYQNNERCIWSITVQPGFIVWLQVKVGAIGPNDNFTVYDGSTINPSAVIWDYSWGQPLMMVMSTQNSVVVVQATNDDGISGGGIYVVFQQASYVPYLSYTPGNSGYWNVYLPYVSPIVQPSGAIRLVDNVDNTNGAMWATTPFSTAFTDFHVVVQATIGNANAYKGEGLAIFVVSNSSIPSANQTSYSFGVDFNNFAGLISRLTQRTSSLFASFSPNITSSPSRTMCNYTNNIYALCSLAALNQIQQNLTFRISVTTNNALTMTVCLASLNGGCQTYLWLTPIGGSLTATIPSPLMFGIGATNSGTNNNNFLDIRSVSFYAAANCNITCTRGVCVGSNVCVCPAGWTDSLCTTPFCTNPCQNGGSCTSPETCTCTAGWTGAACSSPFCNFNSTINLGALGNYTFYTDNYPLNYLDNERCGLTLVAASNNYISVKINASTMDVGNDFLYIYDNKYNFVPLELSANCYGANLILSNNITIYFVSDNNTLTGSGFFINFTIGPLSSLTNITSGSLINANCNGKYLGNDSSRWTIRVQPGWIQFIQLDIWSLGNLGDGLYLYDGPNATSRLITHLHTSNAPGHRYVTHTSETFVQFNSGINNGGTGFIYTFWQRSTAVRCAPLTNITNQLSGTFQSEYFSTGGFYQNNETCIWKITVQPGFVVWLQMNLGYVTAGANDSFAVYDGSVINSSAIIWAWGYKQSFMVTSTKNTVLVVQATDDNGISGAGLYVTFQQASYVPNLSYASGNYGYWNVYLPYGSPIVQPRGAIRLVDSVDNTNGVMWAKTPFSSAFTSFHVEVQATIGNASASKGDGLAIFVVSNSSIPSINPTTYSFGVDLNNFAGLVTRVTQQTRGVFASFSPALMSSQSRMLCNNSINFFASCVQNTLLQMQQNIRILISVTTNNAFTMSTCLASTGTCQDWARPTAINGNVTTTLPAPLMFGIGASNTGTNNNNFLDIRSVSFYAAANCNINCTHGVCVGTNVCLCSAGWTDSICNTPICTNPCQNGGSCTVPDTCTCASGWTDAVCATPICSPSCVNGNCTAPAVCTCAAGWTDSICSEAICTMGCMMGNCSSPDNCVCDIGWNATDCSNPICTQHCANGANCTAPDACTCAAGWTGSLCTNPICSPACGVQGTCVFPDTCSCNNGWLLPYCYNANCTMPCLNNGVCSAPQTCSCVAGYSGISCEIPTKDITFAAVLAMTDQQLANFSQVVTQAMTNLTTKAFGDPTAMASAIDYVTDLADRYFNATVAGVVPLPIFVGVVQTIFQINDYGIYPVANTSEKQTAYIPAPSMTNCPNRELADIAEPMPTQPPPVFSVSQLQTLYDQFTKLLYKLFTHLADVIPPGSNMAFAGDFYTAVVMNIYFEQLPGLVLETSRAKVTFPAAANPIDIISSIPTGCSALRSNTTIPVVLATFIVNTNDATVPFNMPTVIVKAFCHEQLELTLNPSTPIVIHAVTSKPKEDRFAEEQVNSKCDVSVLSCTSDNVNSLGSLWTIPIFLNAGDLVLNLPGIPINYMLYISVGSMASLKNYNWFFNVNTSSASVFQNGNYSASITFNYVAGVNLQIIIPRADLIQLTPSNVTGTVYVLMVNDLSEFRNGALPSAACNQHPCNSYQLAVRFATRPDDAKRRKRAVDPSTDDGFELQPDTNISTVVFKSSYFGDFGADLAIAPNTIEFATVFANFSTLVADNWAVLAFQIVAVVIFIIAVVFAYRFDRADLKEWAFLPIVSNKAYHRAKYLVSVDHMTVHNANLGPMISIRLIGNIHDTNWRLLHDGVRKNFEGKRPANFSLGTQLPVGTIEAIELKVDSQQQRIQAPYKIHIDRVTIVDVDRGLKYIYLAKASLQSGDAIRVTLATEDELKGYAYLVTGHSRTSISDIHPWISVLQRPLPSNWTRAERLGCVVSALFMAMLVNAMFYGKESTAPGVDVKVGNRFTISWFTIWTSFIGCLIAVPPTAVIAFIFKKVKRQTAVKSEWETVFNVKVRDANEVNKLKAKRSSANRHAAKEIIVGVEKAEKEEKEKKPLQLPFHCAIIGWILVAACVGCSAFFVVMYSLSWGQAKSLQWLSGMVLAIVQDIILIQPVKVLVMAILSATVHNLPDDGLELGKLTYNQNTNRRRIELFFKLRGVITGIMHHILYVIVFAVVIATMTNRWSFSQLKVLRPLVELPTVEQLEGTITDHSIVFNWLQKQLIPNFLTGNQVEFGGKYNPANFLYRIQNPEVYFLGPIRLRQQRVTKDTCPLNTTLGKLANKKWLSALNTIPCQQNNANSFGVASNSEHRPFNGSWSNPIYPDPYFGYSFDINNLSSELAPWVYRKTDGAPYSGWEATYFTGGYYVDLPRRKSAAIAAVANLRNNRWLDNSTTVLFVEFNLFNAQCNLFIPVRVVFESLDEGGMAYHVRMFPLQLYQYSGASSTLIYVVQALWFILLISHLVQVIRAIRKQGFAKFKSSNWNWMDLCQILLGLGVVGIFASRIYFVISALNNIKTMRTSFISLDLLVNWEDVMFCVFGVEFFLAMLLFFRHLAIHKHWAVLLASLSKGRLDLITYICLFFGATIIFAGIAYMIMGIAAWNFSSYFRSILTLVRGLIGQMDTTSIIGSHFYVFLAMFYNAVVMFFGGQVFVVLILSAYSKVMVDVERNTNWDAELAEFMSFSVTDIISSRRKKFGKSVVDLANTLDEQLTTETEKNPFEPVGQLTDFERVVDRFERFAGQQISTEVDDESKKRHRCEMAWLAYMIQFGDQNQLRSLIVDINKPVFALPGISREPLSLSALIRRNSKGSALKLNSKMFLDLPEKSKPQQVEDLPAVSVRDAYLEREKSAILETVANLEPHMPEPI